jgi:hypothetical protein
VEELEEQEEELDDELAAGGAGGAPAAPSSRPRLTALPFESIVDVVPIEDPGCLCVQVSTRSRPAAD